MFDPVIVIVFLFGLIIGSFLNVVILRFDDWLSIIKSRSACPNCKTQLRWYDLVPLLSYIQLRGKCRYCRKSISWQYPVVELSVGLLFVALYTKLFLTGVFAINSATILLIIGMLAISCMVVIFFHDFYEMLIPDSVSYLLLVATIAFSLLYYHSVITTGLGLLIGVAPIALLVYPSKGKWMGEGDVKVAAALGAMVGYPLVFVYLISSFVSGGLVGLIAIATRNAKLKSAIPFAPFLIIGALVALFYGERITNWYLELIGMLPLY